MSKEREYLENKFLIMFFLVQHNPYDQHLFSLEQCHSELHE
jgi:hypothetical protein